MRLLSNKYVQLIVALLVAGLLFLPKELYTVPGLSLDDSWQIAINLAFQQGLTFGKDLVFTGGPLYFLSTKTDIGISRAVLFLFDVFLMGLYAYSFYLMLQKIKDWKVLLPGLLILFLYAQNDTVFKTYYVLLFLLLYALFEENKYALWLSGTTAILLFFIKLNLGLISIFIVLAVVFYLLYQAKDKKKYVFMFIYFVVLLGLLAFLLHVDLVSYVLTALPIIDAYNDAMAAIINLSVMKITLAVAALSIGLYVLAVVLHIRPVVKEIKYIFLLGVVALTLYIGFKQQFVRAFGSGIAFLSFAPAVIALPYFFIQELRFKKNWGYAVLAVLLLNLGTLGMLAFQKQATISYALPYSHQVSAEKYEALVAERRAALQLPPSFLEKIGDRTVDVMPWDICYVYFNELRYNPRPIMQSYSVYHKKLQEINYQKYTDVTAPDKILFAFNAIDGRHPLWDESMLLISVLQNYEIQDTVCLEVEKSVKEKNPYFNDTLLLLSRKYYPPLHYEKTAWQKGSVGFGEKIVLDTTEALQLLQIDLQYSGVGKARRILFQPSLLQAELTYADGTTSTHRLILPNAHAGILVGRKVSNWQEAKLFLATQGQANIPATSIRIFSHEPYSFQKNYNFVVEKIKMK